MHAEDILDLINELKHVKQLGFQLDDSIQEFRRETEGERNDDDYDPLFGAFYRSTRRPPTPAAVEDLRQTAANLCRALSDAFLLRISPVKTDDEYGYGYEDDPEVVLRARLEQVRKAAGEILAAVLADIVLDDFEQTQKTFQCRINWFRDQVSAAMVRFRQHEVTMTCLMEYQLANEIGMPLAATSNSTETPLSAAGDDSPDSAAPMEDTELLLRTFREKVSAADRREYSCEYNWDRDVWIFEQQLHHHTWTQILTELGELSPTRGWYLLLHRNSVRGAAQRIARFIGVKPLNNRNGRPRRKTAH